MYIDGAPVSAAPPRKYFRLPARNITEQDTSGGQRQTAGTRSLERSLAVHALERRSRAPPAAQAVLGPVPCAAWWMVPPPHRSRISMESITITRMKWNLHGGSMPSKSNLRHCLGIDEGASLRDDEQPTRRAVVTPCGRQVPSSGSFASALLVLSQLCYGVGNDAPSCHTGRAA